MNIIIFSKNRAAQLHLLLRSMNRFWDGWRNLPVKVLYKATTDDFQEGYTALMDLNLHNVTFTAEKHFHDDLSWMVNPAERYTVFFCDDDVFIRPFNGAVRLKEDEVCMSLRLAPGLTRCIPAGIFNDMPVIEKNRFKWNKLKGDYGYPMSLDGHFFRTNDILPIIQCFAYRNPNELEYQLSKNPPKRYYIRCMDAPVVLNIPANQVQTMWRLPHGKQTAESLNDQFLQGKVIDFKPLVEYKTTSCHEILTLNMI